MAGNDMLLEKLLAALLSVNGYQVDRALRLMPALREAGILAPDHESVANLPQGDMIKALVDAGYNRGGYLPIMSCRVSKFM